MRKDITHRHQTGKIRLQFHVIRVQENQPLRKASAKPGFLAHVRLKTILQAARGKGNAASGKGGIGIT
jgi:hypothetical protein